VPHVLHDLSARENALRSSGGHPNFNLSVDRSRSPSIYDRPSTADLNGLPAPAMRGVHAPLNRIAIAVVIVRIVVTVVVIVVWIVATVAVADPEAVPEVAVVESATITIVESASEAATMTTIMESASHATVEAAAFEAATTESATGKAATVKTSTTEATSVATAKAAAHAASTAATAMATSTSAASAATATATRQGHCWRNQANGRNRQQCDNRFAQHYHSPSEIALLTTKLTAGGDRL
jgi:hypothetical protein